MHSSFSLIVAALAAGVSLGRAADLDLSKLPAPATLEGVTYAKNIQPIFEAMCFRCHGEERQKGDLRLDSLPAVLKGSEHGVVIVPGKSQESKLVHAVARLDDKTAMPPKPRGGPPRGPGGGSGTKQPSERPNTSKPSTRKEGSGVGGGGGVVGGASGNRQGPGPTAGAGGTGNRAAPAFKAVTPQQVGLIRAWIDQGAK